MNQEEVIAALIDEFNPTKKENLIIIFTFASSGLVLFLPILSPNYLGIVLVLATILFGVGCMIVFWKIFRLLGPLGLFWWIRT